MPHVPRGRCVRWADERGTEQGVRPGRGRRPPLHLVGRARPVQRRGRRRGRAVRDHVAAAQRHGVAAHRPRPRPQRAGRHHPPCAHAGLQRAVAAGHRSRRHRHAERRRAGAREGRTVAARPRPRGIRRAGVAVARRVGGDDPAPDAPAGRVVRLAPVGVHPRRALPAGRARDVRHAVRAGPDLPRPAVDQLVPPGHVGDLRHRGGPRRGDGRARLHPLSGLGRWRRRRRCHHARGDDARRHRGGGPSRRRAVPGADRHDVAAATGRARHPGHRRRARGSGVRHGGGEGDPRTRPQRLRDRQAPRPRGHRRHDRRGPDQHQRRRVRRHGSFRGAREGQGRPARPRPAGAGRAAHALGGSLLAVSDDRRAAAVRPVVRRGPDAGTARRGGSADRLATSGHRRPRRASRLRVSLAPAWPPGHRPRRRTGLRPAGPPSTRSGTCGRSAPGGP